MQREKLQREYQEEQERIRRKEVYKCEHQHSIQHAMLSLGVLIRFLAWIELAQEPMQY